LAGYLSATNLTMSNIATIVFKQKQPADIPSTVLSTYSKPVI